MSEYDLYPFRVCYYGNNLSEGVRYRQTVFYGNQLCSMDYFVDGVHEKHDADVVFYINRLCGMDFSY